MNKRALIVVAVVAVLVIASAAVALIYLNNGTNNPDAAGAISIVDDRGKTVNMTSAPQRIVSLGSAFTEIIFDLGDKDKVVGVDSSSWWLVENSSMTSNISNMGGVSKLSVESVLAKNPDLVVIWNFNMYSSLISGMENASIPVAAFYPKNVTTILHTIDVLGEGIGEKVKADEMVSSMQTRINAVTAKMANLTDDEKPRIYLELQSMGGATVSAGSISDELIIMAGGINVFHVSPVNKTNWVAMPESIIEANPDIIVIENQSSKTNDQLKITLGTDVTAVSEDKIYRIDGTTLTTSPSVVDALEQMAQWFHPEMYT